MILFLSSGLRPRYLQDIVRAISMPVGSHLRFRYEDKYIPPALRERWLGNKLQGESALLTYLDATTASSASLVPCRYASIVHTGTVGTIYVATFCLREFAHCDDALRWTEAVRNQASGFPRLNDADLDGYLCEESASSLQNVTPSPKIVDWQRLVVELSKRKDFAGEPYFFHVLGLRQFGANTLVEPCSGSFPLNAETDYELSIIHYSARSGAADPNRQTPWLVVAASDERVSFSTNPKLCIDSPYDEKVVRLRSESLKDERGCFLTLFSTAADALSEPHKGHIQFDLPLTLTRDYKRITYSTLLIGGLIAAQGLANAWEKPWPVQVFIVAGSLMVAAIAVLGIKKVG